MMLGRLGMSLLILEAAGIGAELAGRVGLPSMFPCQASESGTVRAEICELAA
jgi:hypothetical protein